jgi:hypothetical protein
MASLRHFVEIAMSGRSSTSGKTITLGTLLFTSSLLLAQSQWKEIPVGYNMPKSALSSAMTASSAMAFATKGAAKTASSNSTYAGEGRDPNHPWEVEFHGGGFFSLGGEGGGKAKIFPPAASFNSGPGGIGPASLQVPSYFFGDGAPLYNRVATGAGFSNTIAPLDPFLASQIGTRNNGPSIGFRLGRDLNDWFQIELSADWVSSAVEIGDKQLLALENTRQSFANSFNELLPGMGATASSVAAIADVKRSQGSQLFWTGVVNVNLKPTGKTVPYLTFGGGAVSRLGPTPHAALLGAYSFTFLGAPYSEMDIVNVEARAPRTQALGILGGGIRYFATPRWGLRVDVRDHVYPNSIDTVLSATPTVATLAPAAFVFEPGGGSNLIFSNDPSQGPSTLSGPPIHGLRTFRPDGIINQLSATAGVFYRF